MRTLRILDLFCGAGGCAVGYHRAFTAAGYTVEITGVDTVPQPRYSYHFCQADAMTFPLDGYDFIHASPPCQEYSVSRHLRNACHPLAQRHDMLLDTISDRLRRAGTPWIIENVESAPMPDGVLLCGSMFGLNVRRHRRFASSQLLFTPRACAHTAAFVNVVGGKTRGYGDSRTTQMYLSGDGRQRRREKCLPKAIGMAAMGIDWMTTSEMSQAIPPAYTEWLGRQIAAVIAQEAVV